VDRRSFLLAAGVAPFALRGGVAYVTADTESKIVAVSLSTGRIVRSISTLANYVEAKLGQEQPQT